MIGQFVEAQIDGDVGGDREDKDQRHDTQTGFVHPGVLVSVLDDGAVGVLLLGADEGNDQQGAKGSDIGVENDQGADAVDPHHGGRRVADHRAGAAGVRGGNDGGEETDMHLAAEKLMRHGTADQRRGDVVEEAGEDEDHHQHHETAFPVVRQVLGQDDRHVALLEMAREQAKAHQ